MELLYSPQNTDKMTDQERRKYILELFEDVGQDSMLIISRIGHLERLYCPFYVRVIADVHVLKKGSVRAVKAVKMSMQLIDVYVIESGAYNHFNFIILGQVIDNKTPGDES